MFHTETDHMHLITDPTLFVFSSEGRPQGIVPYRRGGPSIIMRLDAQGVVRPFPGMLPAQFQHMLARSSKRYCHSATPKENATFCGWYSDENIFRRCYATTNGVSC
jgi:hypothetical protein